uniref:Reverse transcriptase Ty1/copia-type domain-containing protein n=1 Tax=Solanum lycopersicum TaxID=4081 RepID=A0A3Q7GP66_SOLLC
MIDEGVEHEEQPDEIVEQGEQLGDSTEQMEYPEEEKSQPLRRSERQRVESTKYPSSEYVLINDEGQDKELIAKLKKDLSKSFDMKDLGPTQQILGMKIVRERTKRKLWLSQEKYIERVLERFNMKSAKPVSMPLASHLNLSKQMCPTTKEEKEGMAKKASANAMASVLNITC